MRRILVATLAVFALGTATPMAAQDRPASMDAKRASIYQGAPGRALTGPSAATPVATVAQFLRERGVSASTVASLRVVAQYRSLVTGLVHVRMEQEVAGLRVADAYVKDRKSTRLNSSHIQKSRMPSSA